MKRTANTLDFVRTIMQRLTDAQILTWLAGGWAKELWGLSPPWQHNDVDLLYPASDFHQLDQWLSSQKDMPRIQAKSFSHKRAVECNGIMIEFLLLEPTSEGYITHYFDDKYRLLWPSSSLSHLLREEHSIPVASCQALELHRQHYLYIAEAYQAYLKEQNQLAAD